MRIARLHFPRGATPADPHVANVLRAAFDLLPGDGDLRVVLHHDGSWRHKLPELAELLYQGLNGIDVPYSGYHPCGALGPFVSYLAEQVGTIPEWLYDPTAGAPEDAVF